MNTQEKPDPRMLCFPSLHSSQVGKQIGKTSSGIPIYELKRTALPLVSAALWIICAILLPVFLIGCQPVENDVRDALAANKGFLESAIQKHAASCMANPSQQVCEIIVKDAYYQGAAVSALEAYCQIPAHSTANPPQKCKPVRSLADTLTTALKNVKSLEADIRKAAE